MKTVQGCTKVFQQWPQGKRSEVLYDKVMDEAT